MDDIMLKIFEWLITNFPIIGVVFISIVILLFLLKMIKEIFFSKDEDGQTFGQSLINILYFWKKNDKKDNLSNIKEIDPVLYTDEERSKVIDDLLIHNFFVEINRIKTKIPSMTFGSNRKNEVLRNVIRIYVETIEKNAMDFIKNNKLDELTTNQLNEKLYNEIQRTSDNIYNKMKENLGKDLYELLIEHPEKGFKSKNSFFREIFINGVLLISSQSMSVYNYDNYNRCREILTSMYISLQTIVGNFEKTFNSCNGEVEKLLKK